jgi:hypothetical protein
VGWRLAVTLLAGHAVSDAVREPPDNEKSPSIRMTANFCFDAGFAPAFARVLSFKHLGCPIN